MYYISQSIQPSIYVINPDSSKIDYVDDNECSYTVKLKKNPVKKISRQRSQDKKAPRFSHFIKVTLLGNFPLKK
jgi:hypothetical protein